MRVLVDENDVPWDDAWEITRKVCAYTNHTIMAEALEKWPMELFSRLLPRIYQIVEEINRRYCLELQAKYGMDPEKLRRMAIIARRSDSYGIPCHRGQPFRKRRCGPSYRNSETSGTEGLL